MILPIRAYGDPVLRQKTTEVTKDYPHFKALLANMWETMYNASGVGLAAPQVGVPIRLFIVDATPFAEDEDLGEERTALENFKKVFINPKKIEETGEEWKFQEGCLSIPNVRQDVSRKDTITLEYQDENWKKQRLTLTGLAARVVQHEYDHLEGVLFTDYLTAFKRKLVANKLNNISKGKAKADYPMQFPK